MGWGPLLCASRPCEGRGSNRREASCDVHAILGKDHRFGPADDEGVSPFEEIGDHLREGLRPFNHQRVTSVVNEHQMRIRNELFVNASHLCWDHSILGTEHHQDGNLQSPQPFFQQRIWRRATQPPHERQAPRGMAGSIAGVGGVRSG